MHVSYGLPIEHIHILMRARRYWQYLHVMCFAAPVGFVICFWRRTDAKWFLVFYATAACVYSRMLFRMGIHATYAYHHARPDMHSPVGRPCDTGLSPRARAADKHSQCEFGHMRSRMRACRQATQSG